MFLEEEEEDLFLSYCRDICILTAANKEENCTVQEDDGIILKSVAIKIKIYM